LHRNSLEFNNGMKQVMLKRLHDHRRISVRACQWFWYNGIYNTQLPAVRGRQFQLLRNLTGLVRISIQDSCRPFRRNDLINGVLQHQYVIGDGECHCPSTGSFTDDSSHNWHR